MGKKGFLSSKKGKKWTNSMITIKICCSLKFNVFLPPGRGGSFSLLDINKGLIVGCVDMLFLIQIDLAKFESIEG